MGATKYSAKKKRLIALAKKKAAPRWADLKKFGKRARSRRIRVHTTKHWRRKKMNVINL